MISKRLIINSYSIFKEELSSELYSWGGFPVNSTMTLEHFNQKAKTELHGKCFNYLAFLKDQPEILIGQFKIINGNCVIEINPAFRNQGYGTELVMTVLEQQDIGLATSVIEQSNIASQKVFLKCGFKKIIDGKKFHTYQYTK